MSFLSRELLWLLLVVPVLVGVYVALMKRGRSVLKHSDLSVIRSAIERSQSFRRHVPPLLLLLAITLLLLAVARPAAVATFLAPQRTIVLAIDVSLSMAATDIQPSRLAA